MKKISILAMGIILSVLILTGCASAIPPTLYTKSGAATGSFAASEQTLAEQKSEIAIVNTEHRAQTTANTDRSDITADIGESAALTEALTYVGLSEHEVTCVRIDRDIERGVPVYEVEFRNGLWDYEIEIDARSGEIVSYEKEFD